MQFLYPALAWGFLLALIPIAIHLINLVRQRRVDWAAMEFLLHAYKKHRRWIWLKQLLLLFMRVLAIALIVAMLAHLVTARQWTRFLGEKTTHHLVLLDDSFSMMDRDTSSVFDRAMHSVQDLAKSAAQQSSLQRFTLMRFSRAASVNRAAIGATDRPTELGDSGESGADIDGMIVDDRFQDLLAEQTANLHASEYAVGPEDAVKSAVQLVKANDDEQFVVYIVSDFRQRQWRTAKELTSQLMELLKSGADVRMVRCVDDVHTNLAVSDLRPAEGTRAAGVPMFFDVTVKNVGDEEIQTAAVSLYCDTYRSEESTASESSFATQILPAVTIGPLAPGDTTTERFQVYFPTAGSHVVRAVLPPDSVPADNLRASVVDVPDGIPTLIIDGNAEQQNARYLITVFQPGERVQTGIRPTVHDVAFLRDATARELAGFESIFLLDVARLDERARRNLGEYVRAGGGLAIFLGPETSLAAYNEWHAADPDLLSVQLERIDRLGTNPTPGADLSVTDHVLFRALQGDGNPFLRGIRIDQYVRLVPTADVATNAQSQVIANVRSGHPFAVSSRVGAGRVVVVASSLAPLWNNWATQPSFVVFLLELQSYLASQQSQSNDFVIGASPPLTVPTDQYQPRVTLSMRLLADATSSEPRGESTNAADGADASETSENVSPEQASARRPPTILSTEVQLSPDATVGNTNYVIGWEKLASERPNWARAGILTFELLRSSGISESRRFAMNVAPEEGELALASDQELWPEDVRQSVAGANLRIFRPGDLHADDVQQAGFRWTEIFLVIVCLLLLLEQVLAYVLSYHPAPSKRFA